MSSVACNVISTPHTLIITRDMTIPSHVLRMCANAMPSTYKELSNVITDRRYNTLSRQDLAIETAKRVELHTMYKDDDNH